MTWIWLNVPLAVIFTAFAVGLPLWVILKHPADAPETSPDQVPSQARAAASIPDDEAAAESAHNRPRRAA